MSRGFDWTDGTYQQVTQRTYPGLIPHEDELRGSPHELSPSDVAALRLWGQAERSEMVVRCNGCPAGEACCRNEPPRRGWLSSIFRRSN